MSKSKYQLVDVNGDPLRKETLLKEQAAPSLHSVRQPYGDHPSTGLTPARLARLLRDSIAGDPMPYLELAEDIEEKDLHYAAVLGVRKRQVSGLEITVTAGGEDTKSMQIAEEVRGLVTRDSFVDEAFDILDAIGKGFSATEIIWETSAKQWMPIALEHRDPRHFTFDQKDGKTLLLKTDEGNVPLDAYKWIFHKAKIKSGLPIRGGIARVAAWSFLFKSFTIKDWAIFCEAYGQPLRLGKYDANASEEEKRILLRAVAGIGTDYGAIVPEGMSIEFVQATISGSHELYERRSDWLDRQVSKVVLGQTATTDAQAGGHAVGKVHDGVRDDIEKADARQLSATINRDLVRPFVDLNYGPQDNYPIVKVGRPDEEDIEALVGHVEKLVPLGLPVSHSVMLKKLNLPEPKAGEKLLGATTPEEDNETSTRNNETKKPVTEKLSANITNLSTSHPSDSAEQLSKDAIDLAIDQMFDDGSMGGAIEPTLNSIQEELSHATSVKQALSILENHKALTDGFNEKQFGELLAKSGFASFLAGYGEEAL